MGGLENLLRNLLTDLGLENQPWIGPVLFVVVLTLIWPYLMKTIDTDRGRRRLKGMSDLPLPERQKAQQEALELVGDDPDGLIAVIDESIRQNDKDFAKVGLERLKATGKKRDHVRRIESALQDRNLQLPEQTVIAVERLIESAMYESAKERLTPAIARWPEHEELKALAARVDELLRESAADAEAAERGRA